MISDQKVGFSRIWIKKTSDIKFNDRDQKVGFSTGMYLIVLLAGSRYDVKTTFQKISSARKMFHVKMLS